MKREKISKGIADDIFNMYSSLKGQHEKKKILLTIKDYIETEYSQKLSITTIKSLIHNPEYYEFVKSFDEDNGIGNDNKFVKVLSAMRTYGTDINGKNLAAKLDEKTVSRELAKLSNFNLVEHTSATKFIITEEGREYLQNHHL